MENKIDIKKIVGNGNMAKLSHIIAGAYFYEVITEEGTYQFPVRGFKEDHGPFFKLSVNEQASPEVKMTYIAFDKPTYTIAEDLGHTTLFPEIKAMQLMRWIKKAIDNDELCKIG